VKNIIVNLRIFLPICTLAIPVHVSGNRTSVTPNSLPKESDKNSSVDVPLKSTEIIQVVLQHKTM